MAKKKMNEEKVQGVGDVNGTEKGSAARFNTGKMRYDLLDIRTLIESLKLEMERSPYINVLHSLADFQHGGSSEDLLDASLTLSNLTRDKWTKNPSCIGSIPWDQCAEVFEYGAKKYSAWNWLRGQAWSIPLACCLRHLAKIQNGEWIDAESGKTHLGHFLCNVMMLCYYEREYPEGDDRPPFLSNQ